jgi:hypothetical protein
MNIGYWLKIEMEIDHWKGQYVGVDNIKLDVGEMGWGSVYWIDLAQDRDHW